jgi:hypothetical protein
VLVLGGLTPWMLRVLRIVEPSVEEVKHDNHLPTHIDRNVEPQPDADQTITESDLNQPVFGWLYRLDIMYILYNVGTFDITLLMKMKRN